MEHVGHSSIFISIQNLSGSRSNIHEIKLIILSGSRSNILKIQSSGSVLVKIII